MLAVPTMVLDRPGWLSVNRSTNSRRLMSPRMSCTPEDSQRRLPSPSARPIGPRRQFFSAGRGAAGRAAPDQRARARRGRGGDEALMLALDRRVGDLEDVEDTHGEVVGQVRQRSRHPDKADLPRVAQRLQGLDGPVRLQLGPAGRHVHLQQVEAVRAEPAQALLDPGPDVAGAVVVRERRPGTGWRVARQATAFRGQEVLLAAVTEMPADELLAAAVIDRRVDQVDPAVEHGVQQAARLLIVDGRSPGWPRSSIAP